MELDSRGMGSSGGGGGTRFFVACYFVLLKAKRCWLCDGSPNRVSRYNMWAVLENNVFVCAARNSLNEVEDYSGGL